MEIDIYREQRDWASVTQGPPVPQGRPRAPGLGRFPVIQLGGSQGTRDKVWGLLSKGKQLLRKLGSGKKE